MNDDVIKDINLKKLNIKDLELLLEILNEVTNEEIEVI